MKLNNTWRALEEKLLYYQVYGRKYLYMSVSDLDFIWCTTLHLTLIKLENCIPMENQLP